MKNEHRASMLMTVALGDLRETVLQLDNESFFRDPQKLREMGYTESELNVARERIAMRLASWRATYGPKESEAQS